MWWGWRLCFYSSLEKRRRNRGVCALLIMRTWAKELSLASNTWKMDFYCWTSCMLTLDFYSVMIIWISVVPKFSSEFPYHSRILFMGSNSTKTLSRPEFTRDFWECIPCLLVTSSSVSFSSFNSTSPSLKVILFPAWLALFYSLFQEWHHSPPNHQG